MNKIIAVIAVAVSFNCGVFAGGFDDLRSAAGSAALGALQVPAAGAALDAGLSAQDKVVDGMAILNAAVKAAQKPGISEQYKFWIESYPVKTKLITILSDVTGYSESDINLDDFAMSSGNTAVSKFAADLKKVAKELSESDSGEETMTVNAILGVAAGAKQAFTPAQFTKIQLASHDIQEDGDVDYRVLIGQNKDGSFFVLSYGGYFF